MRRSILFISAMAIFILFSGCAKEVQKVAPISTGMSYEDSLLLAEKYVAKGIEDQKAENYQAAISQWEKALDLKPNDAEVCNFVGIAWHRIGNYDKAVEYFKRAKAINPEYVDAVNNLGYIFFLQKRYREALVEFELAVKLKPTYQQAVDNLRATKAFLDGRMKLRSYQLYQHAAKAEEPDIQIKRYSEVLTADSMYAEAHNNIGVAYVYQDKLDSAIYHLRKAVKIDPEYSEALNNLGFVFDQLGDHLSAQKLYLASLKKRPGNITALQNLGSSYYESGDKGDSLKVYEKIILIHPGNEEAKLKVAQLRKETSGAGE